MKLREKQPPLKTIIAELKIAYQENLTDQVGVKYGPLKAVLERDHSLVPKKEKLVRREYQKQSARNTISYEMGLYVKSWFDKVRENYELPKEIAEEVNVAESQVDDLIEQINANS